MRLILWHGYLLEGTGSNIYTQHEHGQERADVGADDPHAAAPSLSVVRAAAGRSGTRRAPAGPSARAMCWV